MVEPCTPFLRHWLLNSAARRKCSVRRGTGHAGEKFLPDRSDQHNAPVADQVLDQAGEALVRLFAPQDLRPDAGVDEDLHRLRASL